jgi:DNA-binding response OmpR family regulator
MAGARTYDILLIDAEDSNRQRWASALISRLGARIGVHSHARSALTSFSRTRFDAIVCGSALADTDCWRFVRMIRSGRFGGFPDTPVFVICHEDELSPLEPMLDFHSRLIPSADPASIAEHIAKFEVDRVRASVLVIEDEQHAAQAAARALEKHFEVELVQSGDYGLSAWRQRRHKLVLLDLMLPGMPGVDVLNAILSDDPDQPVIIVTALGAPERHQDLMLAGAVEFLTKPLDLHFLAARCDKILRDRACLTGAAEAVDRAAVFERVAARVHAASYTLRSGRTAEATRHLQHALQACRTKGPTDDQFASLLEEFSHHRGQSRS